MKTSDDFYHGMLAALAIVALHDNPVIFDEIVQLDDPQRLVDVARSDPGLLKWSGLMRYGYHKKYPRRHVR